MSRYLFDSNVCIAYLRGEYDLLKRMQSVGEKNCFLSVITVAELKVGAELCNRGESARKEIADFVKMLEVLSIDEVFDIYAKELARLRRLGMPLDDFDLLIGATAIRYGLVIVTGNTKHFERMEGLQLENWTE